VADWYKRLIKTLSSALKTMFTQRRNSDMENASFLSFHFTAK